jgi:hypothetical protein
MPLLIVANGFRQELPGLGKNTPFLALSEKRVTKAVRECLRDEYGLAAVEVSCEASAGANEWHGRCQISGSRFEYRVLATA